MMVSITFDFIIRRFTVCMSMMLIKGFESKFQSWTLATMVPSNSAISAFEFEGRLMLSGSQGVGDVITICCNCAKSFSVGDHVSKYMIIPFIWKQMVISSSRCDMQRGKSEYGLSWTSIPWCRIWFGLTNECGISGIQRASLTIRIKLCPWALVYPVATCAMGIPVLALYSSEYGMTSQTHSVRCIKVQFRPATKVLAWLSSSHFPNICWVVGCALYALETTRLM